MQSHVLIQMLSKKINNLPLDEPAECEELIRQLNIQISTVEDAVEKEKLLQKLKAVAFFGLEADLKRMLAKKGLRLESLNLVVKYLTNVPVLAKYFHKNESDPQDEDGLENVRKRLGPDIEVLGGLSAVGIDVSQEWVKALCKRAPSLLALPRLSLSSLEDCCKGAEKGDMDEVYRLIEYAESQRSQLADISQDRRLVKEYRDSKALDQENLTKARELMTEAKAMAKHQFEQLNEILNVLELPGDWLKPKGVLPEELLKQLDYISEECSNVVESGETYKSELEVIAKASGGKALCGIYHSDYEAPQPAQIPLFLLPKDVKLNNPSTAQEAKYLKFSKKGMASEYARIVESTSINVGIGVAGFYDTFVGEFQVGYGQDQYSQSDQTATNSKTSASVLQYIRTAKKNFRFDPYQLIISLTARIMARSIVDSASDAEVEQSARFFMKRYGSHYPAGIQSLGGVFFSIADAESNSTKDTFKLTEAAVNHLKAQISYGFLGGAFEIRTSGTSEYASSTVQNRGRQLASSESDSFSYSVKSMGPQATNPATFHKLLSYNSTWALIDRGECQSFIPVWELFSNLGGEFKEVATVLQRTWRKDEAERKTKLEAKRKEREDAKKKKDQQKAREKQLKDAREELAKIKDEHLKRVRHQIIMLLPMLLY